MLDEESELGSDSDGEPPAADDEAPAVEPAALPAVQAGDSTMVRGRYDPRAIARKMNAIVEDLNEAGKLSDQQYLALQNCARDVFNFPMATSRAPYTLAVNDDLRALLAQIDARTEERERAAAIRAVEQQQRDEERAQREREREQRSRERTAELQRRAEENARQLRLREQQEAARVRRQEEQARQRAAEAAQRAAELERQRAAIRARERKAQEDDLKEQGVWLQPPPGARKRARPAPAVAMFRDSDSDSEDDFEAFIANNMQERAVGSD